MLSRLPAPGRRGRPVRERRGPGRRRGGGPVRRPEPGTGRGVPRAAPAGRRRRGGGPRRDRDRAGEGRRRRRGTAVRPPAVRPVGRRDAHRLGQVGVHLRRSGAVRRGARGRVREDVPRRGGGRPLRPHLVEARPRGGDGGDGGGSVEADQDRHAGEEETTGGFCLFLNVHNLSTVFFSSSYTFCAPVKIHM